MAFFNSPRRAPVTVPDPWIRPADWPPIPVPVPQSITALVWLRPDVTEGAAIQAHFSPTSATAQIDWGDGAVDTLTHGGWVNHEWDTSSPGLTAIAPSGKVAILRLIPPTGAQLTQIRISAPSDRTTTRGNGPACLDLEVNLPHTSVISITDSTGGYYLRRFRLWDASVATTFSIGMRGVADCGPLSLPSISSVSLIFSGCENLREIPPISAPIATSAVSLFSGSGLRLADCGKLNLPSVADWRSCFSNSQIEEVINLDHKLITLGSFFSGCRALRRIQGRSTAPTTDCGSILSGCRSLETLELDLDTASVSNWASAFSSFPLKSLPDWDFSGGKNFNQAFRYSYLEDLSVLDAASPSESIYYAAASCLALTRPPRWTLPATLTAANPTQRVFDSSTSLQEPWLVGVYESQDLRSLPMSTDQIAAMLVSLREVPTALQPQNLWLPRPAANSVDAAIVSAARAKGWNLL